MGIPRLIMIILFGWLVAVGSLPGDTLAAEEPTSDSVQHLETGISFDMINLEQKRLNGEYGNSFLMTEPGVDNGLPAQMIPPPPETSEKFLDEGDYYLVRGKKQFIRRDAFRMVVKFSDRAFSNLKDAVPRSAEQATALHSALGVSDSEMALSIERQLDQRRIVIIRAHPKTGQNLLRSHIRDFSTSPPVAYAYPLFVAQMGIDELILTDEIITRFTPEYGNLEVLEFCTENGLSLIRRTGGRLNVYVLRVNDPESRSSLDVANALNDQQGIIWAEPNFLSRIERNTADPLFNDLWQLNNTGQGGGTLDADVDAPEAWALQTAGSNIVIAIIDDGIDLAHQDLAIWRNPGEWGSGKESNGIDDDGNGYVDDYQGWNFSNDDNNPNPTDQEDNHGTSCAGVAAAKGNNNLGVAGIAYGCPLLPVKIITGDVWVTSFVMGEAITYAADLADVISCSWSSVPSGYIEDAIDYAVTSGRGGLGCPVFFAAGNGASRGWTNFTLEGIPSGAQSHGWQYEKDGSISQGADAAWVDDVTLQDGSHEDFNGVAPPLLPADFNNFSNNSADWITVSDASHARGGFGNSLKSGAIGSNQFSGFYVSKDYQTAGDISYYVWVDAGPRDGLYAMYWTGTQWYVYQFFRGEGISFPASYQYSIAVGASNNLDIQSSYSQYGDELDFVAPSNGGTLSITTTDRTGSVGYSAGNYTGDFGGTSSATPLAAGIAALMISKDPNLTAMEVRILMRRSCDIIGPDPYDDYTGWNMYYGYGRVNAYNSIVALDGQHPAMFKEEDFSSGLPGPAEGWAFYSSNSYGRIQAVEGRLRMDVSDDLNYAINEAILTIDMTGAKHVWLCFYQADFSDEIHPLPESFTGHYDGDGVAMSNDGNTWYTIVDAAELNTSASGKVYAVDLNAAVSHIRADYDPSFAYTANVMFKFQQYDNYTYSIDGRAWDDISLIGLQVGDLDGDGVGDQLDNCPNTYNPDQTDSDGDSAGDACDGCPADPDKTDPGVCDCGTPDTDTDGDGTPDCNDNCPADPDKTDPGVCGCGTPDTDTDGDRTPDCEEQGPNGDNPNYDGNADGNPDNLQANVISLPNCDSQYYVTLELAGGIIVNYCQAVDNPSLADAPSDAQFPYGFFEFSIEGMGNGGATEVELYLPTGQSLNTYYKYGVTSNDPTAHWYEFLYDNLTGTGAEINGNIVTLNLVDGLRGDDDLTANGIIFDVGGPGVLSIQDGDGDPSNGDDDGCFIATAAYGSSMQPCMKILRQFRDHFLIENSIGKILVRCYYRYSSPIADCLAGNGDLRAVVRLILLPAVGMSWVAIKLGLVYKIAGILNAG